jgi:hypothetical protein
MSEFVPTITLSPSLNEPLLFGKTFAAPSFWTWKVIAKLIDNIPLVESRELELFKACTGRTQPLNRGDRKNLLRRFVILAGRRAGRIASFQPVRCGAPLWLAIGVSISAPASKPSSSC